MGVWWIYDLVFAVSVELNHTAFSSLPIPMILRYGQSIALLSL